MSSLLLAPLLTLAALALIRLATAPPSSRTAAPERTYACDRAVPPLPAGREMPSARLRRSWADAAPAVVDAAHSYCMWRCDADCCDDGRLPSSVRAAGLRDCRRPRLTTRA